MLPKHTRRLRGGTPVSSQHPSKNININISYNITLGKHTKPAVVNGVVAEEQRRKKPSAAVPERKDKPLLRDKHPT